MASCQTWATSTHFRHPWLDSKPTKRKRPEVVTAEEDSDSTETGSVLPPKHASKKRRCTLENGFAHLTLSSGIRSPSDVRVQEVPSPDHVMDAEMSIVPTVSYVVEEPFSQDVKMKTSSWYELEPDRIVITDLDSYSEDEDAEENTITVNTALLEKIRSQVAESVKVPANSDSRALVLFRPLPQLEAAPEVEESRKATHMDENAMEVEP